MTTGYKLNYGFILWNYWNVTLAIITLNAVYSCGDSTGNREKRQSLKIRTGAARQAGNPRGKLFTSINTPATSPFIQEIWLHWNTLFPLNLKWVQWSFFEAIRKALLLWVQTLEVPCIWAWDASVKTSMFWILAMIPGNYGTAWHLSEVLGVQAEGTWVGGKGKSYLK